MPVQVAILDDSEVFRLGLVAVINKNDFTTITFESDNLQLFLDHIKQQKVDVLLFNYKGEGFSQKDIVKIKLADSSIKIIGITHSPVKTEINEGLSNGLISHIKKECPTYEIIDAIKESYQGNHFFCGDVLTELNKDDISTQKTVSNCESVSLSSREMDIVKLISEGYTNAQIAVVLHISNHTVNTHRKNIIKKLGVGNTAGIVMFAVKTNLVNPDKFDFNPKEN